MISVVNETETNRSDQEDVNDYVTYTVAVTTVFKGDTGGEAEISFITAGNSAACGIGLEIGQEYVLALAPAVDNPLEPAGIEGELSVEACGLYRVWDELPDEERDDLQAGCAAEDPCLGTCDEYQVNKAAPEEKRRLLHCCHAANIVDVRDLMKFSV